MDRRRAGQRTNPPSRWETFGRVILERKKIMKTKVKPIDRAQPTIRKPKGSDPEKIQVTRSTTAKMQGSLAWNQSPEIQAVATAWNKGADAIEANAKIVTDLRGKLALAEAEQRTLRRDWNATTRKVIATAAVYCQGSADQVHALGFDVRPHGSVGPVGVPAGITTTPGKELGEVLVRWERSGRRSVAVQHATDVANAATFSAPIPRTAGSYVLKGAIPGSTVHFRVAEVDPSAPSGLGPWSDWVAGTAR
jgi:hypothetical protein